MLRAIAFIFIGALLNAGRAAAEYKESVVTNGGTISGRVRVAGDVPVLPPQPVFKQKETCGEAVPDERLVIGQDAGLANAVLVLTDITAGKAVPRERAVHMDNRRCAFVPHVLNATVGQMIEITNSDPFLHDAHAMLGSRTLFNVAIPKGRTVHRPLAYAGVAHINCNIRHTWMHAYLFIAEHPYHVVTDTNGRFTIADVPPGTYTLRAWHEMLGSVEQSVKVEAGKTATVELALQGVAAEAP
jgi:plastocyanin